MKRKHFAIIYLLTLCMGTILSFYIPKPESVQASEETVVIPKEAIRLRILANSDSSQDQTIKRAVRDEVNANITKWVKDLTSLEDARRVIQSHLTDIQHIAEAYVKEKGLSQQVKVDFGKAQFPTKLYGQYLYPAGEYEAIVITIGEGKGANWWCVLFPPLCFLEFSNGTAVSQSPMEDEEDETPKVDALEEEGPEANTDTLEQEEKDPVYVEQDEKTEVLEKRVFVVDIFKELFSE